MPEKDVTFAAAGGRWPREEEKNEPSCRFPTPNARPSLSGVRGPGRRGCLVKMPTATATTTTTTTASGGTTTTTTTVMSVPATTTRPVPAAD